MNKRMTGSKKEALAAVYLKQQGIDIVCQNYRVRQGEIDLIGWEKGSEMRAGRQVFTRTLLFIEVKYRKNTKNGSAIEAVTYAKQKQISRVSLFYLSSRRLGTDIPIRYDVVAISGEEITWVKNAFEFVEMR